MKRIDRLILKSFLGPLLMTFVIAVFVLLMQFLWRYIDDLVGKGLDFGVILELLLYAAATFVPMALPIAILFASIMTMGNFGERYELVAMKAGGISISRIMRPLIVVALLLTGVAFYFSNNIMPSAMLHYRMTLYDITRKKPAVNIRAGEYYKELDGYVIKVDSKSSDGKGLEGIVIYDRSKGHTESTVIVAKHGKMETSADNSQLIFTLYDGYSYNEATSGENNKSRPLTSIGFKRQTIVFDISSFAYNKTSENLFQGSYHMMNVLQLDSTISVLETKAEKRYDELNTEIVKSLHAWNLYCQHTDTAFSDTLQVNIVEKISHLNDVEQFKISNSAYTKAHTISNSVKNYAELIDSDKEYINRHYIEWHRKFTLSVACLLLFLIGAPFGSIVRKGGMGIPLVASVGFFVLYYMIGMIAEKAVRESAISPIGMWIATFVMLPIGIILTYQATTDSPLFSLSAWRQKLQKLFNRKQ